MMIHKVDDSIVAADEFVDYTDLGDSCIQDCKLGTHKVDKWQEELVAEEEEAVAVALLLQLHYKMVHLAVQFLDKNCYLLGLSLVAVKV